MYGPVISEPLDDLSIGDLEDMFDNHDDNIAS